MFSEKCAGESGLGWFRVLTADNIHYYHNSLHRVAPFTVSPSSTAPGQDPRAKYLPENVAYTLPPAGAAAPALKSRTAHFDVLGPPAVALNGAPSASDPAAAPEQKDNGKQQQQQPLGTGNECYYTLTFSMTFPHSRDTVGMPTLMLALCGVFVRAVLWCGVAWCCVVCSCVLCCGVVWRGVVWCVCACCGVVLCGVFVRAVVWCGVVYSCVRVWCVRDTYPRACAMRSLVSPSSPSYITCLLTRILTCACAPSRAQAYLACSYPFTYSCLREFLATLESDATAAKSLIRQPFAYSR